MSAYPHIIFLDTSELNNADNLARIVEIFLRLGFEIVHTKVRDNYFVWNDFNKTQILTSASHENQLSLQCVNADMNFDIFQDINWDVEELGKKNRAWIQTYTINTGYFWKSVETSEKYSKLLLTIGTDLYNILKPSFGWIDFNFGLYTTHEDIESVKLPALYWANFFGPPYVNKFGEKKILNAPGWKVEILSKNEYLYVLSSGLGLSHNLISTETIKEYFGIEKVR